LSDRDQFFIRLWRDNGTQPTYTDPITPIFNVFSAQPQMQGQISETHTFSPTAINQLIFSAFYYSAFFGSSNEGAALAAFPTVVRFSPQLFSNMGGTNYNFPQGRKVTQYQFLDDFSKTFSHHTLKVGANYRRYIINQRQASDRVLAPSAPPGCIRLSSKIKSSDQDRSLRPRQRHYSIRFQARLRPAGASGSLSRGGDRSPAARHGSDYAV
jgi:hypothetical protein